MEVKMNYCSWAKLILGFYVRMCASVLNKHKSTKKKKVEKKGIWGIILAAIFNFFVA